jgi:hypothetical protein
VAEALDERRVILELLARARTMHALAARCLPSPQLDFAVISTLERLVPQPD